MLIDTHCHLDAAEFDADRDAVVHAAWTTGVGAIVVPAVAVDQFAAVDACCQRYSGCLPAYGIHPLFVDRAGADDLEALRRWLLAPVPVRRPAVAIGEIGLDFYVPGLDAARQETFFVAQLKLAQELDLPVLLHSRRAVDAVLKHLRRIRVRGGIAHAFSGSAQQADEFIRLGFKLGFGGTLTFEGSTRIRQLAAELPLDALVLETDAPDIPPAWRRGGRSTPEDLPAYAEILAGLRGLTVDEIVRATTVNARAVFERVLPAA